MRHKSDTVSSRIAEVIDRQLEEEPGRVAADVARALAEEVSLAV